jgi:hypothetical protein
LEWSGYLVFSSQSHSTHTPATSWNQTNYDFQSRMNKKWVNHSPSVFVLPWLILQIHPTIQSVLLVIFYTQKSIIYL